MPTILTRDVMRWKKILHDMKTAKSKEMIVEKLERITVRYRNRGQRAYCSSCGKPTVWLTAEQAREIFDTVSAPIESVHLTDTEARLICAESMVPGDEEQNNTKE